MRTFSNEPGWLNRELKAALAEVATWDEGIRGRGLSTFNDQAILDGIKLLEGRLEKLQIEAFQRGII